MPFNATNFFFRRNGHLGRNYYIDYIFTYYPKYTYRIKKKKRTVKKKKWQSKEKLEREKEVKKNQRVVARGGGGWAVVAFERGCGDCRGPVHVSLVILKSYTTHIRVYTYIDT